MNQYNISYFLREGINNIFLHRFMSFASVVVVSACLLITSSFMLIAFNVDNIIKEIEGQNEIVVFVDQSLSVEDSKALLNDIMKIDNVKDAEFVSKDQALQDFGSLIGDKDNTLISGLINDNPLRHGYHIFMKDIKLHKETVEALKHIPGIATVNYGKDIADKLITIRSVINTISLTLIIILGIVSVFIISNTVRLATFSRREEIAVMKMVGATNWFIRWPFIVESLLLGEISALIAFVMIKFLYNYLQSMTANINFITFIPFDNLVVTVLQAFLIMGAVVGIGGSLLTIRKFLKV